MPKDPRKTKSKYTIDRNVPGAFEGETITRRRFMTGTAHTAGAVAAGAFALPALGFAIAPIFREHQQEWQEIGGVEDFPDDTYLPQVITIVEGIGEAGLTTIYVRKRNPKLDTDEEDRYNQFIALSTRCMHLGCPVRFTPAAERFICPCHGGVYDFQGKVSGGPPVRPLDRFYTLVQRGRVLVGPRFSVNSELRRFSPRDAGAPLDGIGEYAFPSRPSIRKLPD